MKTGVKESKVDRWQERDYISYLIVGYIPRPTPLSHGATNGDNGQPQLHSGFRHGITCLSWRWHWFRDMPYRCMRAYNKANIRIETSGFVQLVFCSISFFYASPARSNGQPSKKGSDLTKFKKVFNIQWTGESYPARSLLSDVTKCENKVSETTEQNGIPNMGIQTYWRNKISD